MRAASHYFLAQGWQGHERRQIQSRARSRAASWGRQAHALRRDRPGRELPAVARRVLAVLSGTS